MLLLSVEGCWSLSAKLDLGGGVEETSLPEAGADGAPSSRDAAIEAEASGAVDGAALAVEAGADSAPARLCDALPVTPRICDDFDVTPLGARWTRQDVVAGSGSLALGTSPVVSAPNALFARATSTCADGTYAQLIDLAPVAPAEAKLDLDVSVAPMGAAPAVTFVGVSHAIAAAPQFYRVDVAYRAGHLELHSNGPAGFTVLETSTQPFSLDTFHRVSVVITFVGSPRAVVKVDGGVHLDKPIASHTATTAETKLDVGLYTGAACSGAIEVRLDNLVYQLTGR